MTQIITNILADKIAWTEEMRRSPQTIEMSQEFFDLFKKECKVYLPYSDSSFPSINSFAGLKIIIDNSVETWSIK
jgi:hypothetical protein